MGDDSFSPWALCEAISIPGDQDLVDKELLVEPDWISRKCSSLIRLAGEESNLPHFQFAHFTVKEYLRSIKPQSTRSLFRFSEDVAGQRLMATSLRFLTFPIFDRKPTIVLSETQRMNERNDQHPFYPVAAVNFSDFSWPGSEAELTKQFSLLLEDEAMMSYARKLFHQDKTGIFLSWVLQAIWSKRGDRSDESTFCPIVGLLLAPEFSPLHIAAMLALPSVCRHLIGIAQVDPNVRCRIGTPLHALLIGTGLFYDVNDFRYNPEIHFRRHSGPQSEAYEQARICLKILLENGADTSIRWNTKSIFQIAVNNSVRSGYGKAWIHPLINPSTVITDDCIGDFRKYLFSGHFKKSFLDAIVMLSFTPDITPGWTRLASLVKIWRKESKQDSIGPIPTLTQGLGTSDEEFADSMRISITRNLTDTLAVLMQDSRFSPNMCVPYENHLGVIPALHLAINSGNLKSVELLLGAGCDAKVIDASDGWTSLHHCALSRTDEAAITALMIESGVVILAADYVGKTCWHLAAENGNIQVLRILIAKDSNSKRSLATTSNEGRTPLASAVMGEEVDTALLLLDQCHGEREFFASDRSLLDEAVAIGSEVLLIRLHEKLKEAEAMEAINSSKPLDHINMLCSPKALDYVLGCWALDRTAGSDILVKYLLDTNNPRFERLNKYPTRSYVDYGIRRLLPPGNFFGDHDKGHRHSWEVFCEDVVIHLMSACNHRESGCRALFIAMVFDVLISSGILASYEREIHLPGYRLFFRALLNRHDQLECNWIAPSVHKVLEATCLPGDLLNEAVSTELLTHAVNFSRVDLARELLERGVDVHAAQGRLSPLEQAVYSSSLSLFRLIIGYSDRSLINRVGSQGMTLLHWVVSGNAPGCAERIGQLLQLGANVDSETDDTLADTALTLACRTYRQDIVQLLVAGGANSLHRGRDGWTILHTASVEGDFRYIQHLIHSNAPDSFWLGVCDMPVSSWNMTLERSTAIHFAAYNGQARFLARLIEEQIPFDSNAMTGYPMFAPLHLACWFGHLKFVETIISSKADINLKDAFGRRPIDIAANRQHSEILRVLIESGSQAPLSRFVADEMGDSEVIPRMAFETAIVKGQVDLCRRLAENGHSINTRLISCSCRPIEVAILEEQTAIVDWLLSAGVELTGLSYHDVHPSLRCIASFGTHHLPSRDSVCGLLGLALSQNVGWYGSLLGPLHVAILDDKIAMLDTILSHIRMNDHAYRYAYLLHVI